MRVVLAGGSGHLGTLLAERFARQGHDIVILGRRERADRFSYEVWDGETLGPWRDCIDGADVVVNLAGRSVDCRYHARNRREILQSRVRSTEVIGEAIAAARNPPPTWLQASTATIYEHRHDAPNDEATGRLGGDEPDAPSTWKFSIDVAKAWESQLERAVTPRTRKVALRTAIVMSSLRGTPFDILLRLVRFGLGGRSGDGRQYVSWVHEEDFVRAVSWIIDRRELQGPVNIAAPQPLPNAAFMAALRDAWGIGFGLPATRWMLEIGAFFLRTETELVLKSRRVVPGKLLESGFDFHYPAWPQAAVALCEKWRAERQKSARVQTA